MWKLFIFVSHLSKGKKFQKNLVVWKLPYDIGVSSDIPWFQKNLVVWKPKWNGWRIIKEKNVSEELSSVETICMSVSII